MTLINYLISLWHGCRVTVFDSQSRTETDCRFDGQNFFSLFFPNGFFCWLLSLRGARLLSRWDPILDLRKKETLYS